MECVQFFSAMATQTVVQCGMKNLVVDERTSNDKEIRKRQLQGFAQLNLSG